MRNILRDVRRCRDFDEIFNRLGSLQYKWPDGAKPDGAPLFGTIRELLVFAAFLGYHLGRKESLEGCQTDPIPEEVFAKNEDALEAVRLIALADKQDQSIFDASRVDEMVTIFEEYAHGGMKVLQHYLAEVPTDIVGSEAVLQGLRSEHILDTEESGDLGKVQF